MYSLMLISMMLLKNKLIPIFYEFSEIPIIDTNLSGVRRKNVSIKKG
jgi:hypothetical protein